MGILDARTELMDGTADLNFDRWRYQDQGNYRGSEFVKVSFLMRSVSASRTATAVEYQENMAQLAAYADSHELLIFGYAQDYFLSDRSTSLFYEFYLVDRMPRSTASGSGFGPQLFLNEIVVCPACGIEHPSSTIICPECSVYLICTYCESNALNWQSRRITLGTDANYFLLNGSHGCSSCRSICTECNQPWNSGNPATVGQCYDCNPRYSCHNCGIVTDGEAPYPQFCLECMDNCCADCQSFFENGNYQEEEGRNICNRCFNALDRNIEVFDNDSDMPATRLAIPTIEGRERIRFCGLEIEGVNIQPGGHDILAADLYDQGLSVFNGRRGYHERYEGGFAHVERDSSCDWEVVAGPINMAANTDVRNLNRVIKAIRARIEDKTVKLSLNCGLHIHVSAEKVALKQAHNLHLLYTYMEDVFYRIGAAKWPMHRAIVNGDHSYQLCPREVKKVSFVNRYMDNRYHGLSFSNYFQRILNNCMCGAGRFGLFDECECTLTKCTFEFRIFNTTANTRKIHAYTALTQALVAKAFSMNEFDVDEMPALGFNMRNTKDMSDVEQNELFDAWKPRMKFILEELPLTNDEKDSILYCVENSELASVMGYCNEIVNADAEVVA